MAGFDLATGQMLDEHGNPVRRVDLSVEPAPPPPPPSPVVLPEAPPVDLPPAIPVPPISDPVVKSRKETSTTTRRTIVTPGERAAVAEAAALDQRRAEIARETADVEARAAGDQAVAAKHGELAALDHQERVARAMEAGEQEIAVRKAKLDAELDRYSKMEIRDYWADKGTGQKVLAGIAVALGAVAQARGAGPNPALTIINGAIERDFAQQKEAILKQRDLVEAARAGVGDARQILSDQLKALEVKRAAAESALAAHTKAQVAKYGSAAARANGEQVALELEQQAAARKLKLEEAQRREVATNVQRSVIEQDARSVPFGAAGSPYASEATGKPATPQEREADAYAERMANQVQILDSLPPISEKGRQAIRAHLAQEKLLERMPQADAAAKALGLTKTLEQKLSPTDLAAWQALKEFTAANLRKESGAAIGVQEQQQALERFAPVVGDKEANARQKRKNMKDTALTAARQSFRPSHWEQRLRGGPAQQAPAPAAQRPRQLSAEDQQAIQWARSNPKDQRAQKILKLHGM